MLVASFGRYAPENSVAAFGMLLILASFALSAVNPAAAVAGFIGAGTTLILGSQGFVIAQELKRRKNGEK